MKTTKILKSLSILILTTFLSLNAYSQQNFIKGHVVTLNGDTLHGLIDYRNWDKNPDKIVFVREGKTTPEQYSPLDIKSFKANDEIYVSAVVKSDISSRNISNLGNETNLKTEVDTTFLQIIIQGDKSLYYYKNRLGIENFYIKQNGKYDLLVYSIYKSSKEDKVRVNRRYIGQLTLYFNNAPSVQQQLQQADYTRTSLKNLFLTYYNQSSTSPKFQKKTDKGSVEYGIVAGASISSVKFGGQDFIYLTSADIPQSVNPTGGLFLNFVLPRSQGKWSIYNELNYNSFQISTDYNGFYHDIYYTEQINAEFAFSYLSLNNMVRFKYPVKGCFLFINGGFSNGIIIDETNHMTDVGRFRTTESKGLDDIKQHDFGYIGGIGVQYHHFSLDARYKRTGGFSSYVTLSSPVNQYYFLLGYRF